MKPYSMNDPRFAYGRHILLIFGEFNNAEQKHEVRCKIIAIGDIYITVLDQFRNESKLLKSGGGFYFMNKTWDKIA